MYSLFTSNLFLLIFAALVVISVFEIRTIQQTPTTRPIKNIIFDMDDTLLVCGKYYMQQRRVFGEVAEKRTGIPALLIDKILVGIDVACTTLPNGFGKERYPRSFAATSAVLDIVRGFEVDAAAAGDAYHIGNDVFNAEYALFDGVREMLTKYQQNGYNLFMCTKGEYTVQLRKINLHRFNDFFSTDRTYIVGKKTGDIVRQILTDHQLKAEETVFVGDSIKDDVGAAKEAGVRAVLVDDPSKAKWAYEDTTHKPDHVITYVTDLPKVLPL